MSDPRFALIDLGSNSIRMVVFDRRRPYAAPLLNERQVIELGRGLSTANELQPDRMAAALEAFRHFAWLLKGAEIDEVHIFATAAARAAENSAAFLEKIHDIMGSQPEIMSGDQEAALAARGVQLACPGAVGLVADLGGGSLELAELSEAGVGRTASLPLGVLWLEEMGLRNAKAALREALDTLSWWPDLGEEQQLYLVGGTWRALAKAHMARTLYPLNVVHRYAVSAKKLRAYAKRLITRPAHRLDAMEHVSPARRRKLPWAALAAKELARSVKAKRVVFSAAGVREGYSAELLGRAQEFNLPQNARYDRAIAALIPEGGRFSERFGSLGQTLFTWTSPIFLSEKPALRDRRAQACQLFDFGWEAHPDYRKRDVPSALLHSVTLTQSHKDRAYLALVLLLRHGGNLKDPGLPWLPLIDLLPKGHVRHAIAVGEALRLAYKISRGLMPLLSSTQLRTEGLRLILEISRPDLLAMPHLYSAALGRLSSALALEPQIRSA